MATSSLILRCLTIFSFITNIAALTGYQLEEKYSGSNFFDAFNFFTDADPTRGFVTYVNESAASQQGLISVRSNGVYMGVDSKTLLNPGGAGRNSVRIESKKKWTHGLFVADLSHMPGGACGSWPAREIDIIEGVNSQNHNLMSLHAGGACSVSGTGQTGTLQSANCNNFANPVGVGCGISDTRTNSYGAGFNSNGGGIYAMEWTSSHIRVYFFPAGSAPADINGPNPDPSKMGNSRLKLRSDGTCAPKAATCTDYVASNPGAFADQYWLVRSISVYQLGNVASPAPSSPPVVAPPPSSRAPVVAPPQPSAVSPISPISPPISHPRPQPNNNPLADGNPIFSKSPIPSEVSETQVTATPPRLEPTYDPEYPKCGHGGKCPLTSAFTCTVIPNNLQILIPTTPALPSILPAGQLLGIGSGGLPAFNTDVNAELDAAKNKIQALAKQAVAWKNPDSDRRGLDEHGGSEPWDCGENRSILMRRGMVMRLLGRWRVQPLF
ncbi:hypothetical protein DID88_001633 [Monilinia fructigena]|uniref:GH16 domain-containing protein n=1 Tax=Monilinia fructigena TaxID=38457 RepID=A0A395IWC7_9HELO|nr:hypothetical protein DID88_001633 [Monilinia fructigena]